MCIFKCLTGVLLTNSAGIHPNSAKNARNYFVTLWEQFEGIEYAELPKISMSSGVLDIHFATYQNK